MPSASDYFEKSRNLSLKVRVEDLMRNFPIDLSAVIEKAKKLTLHEAGQKPPQYKQRNYMAEVMYGNIIGILNENYPEYMSADQHNRPYIRLADDIRIYLKKLDENYVPNNIVTEHVKDLNAQRLFENEALVNVIYAGYLLADNDWTKELQQICVSYLNRVYTSKAAWIIDLREDQFKKSIPVISYVDAAPFEADSLISLRKTNDNNQENDQQKTG